MRTKERKMTRTPTKENQKDILTPTPLHHHRHHRSQRGKTPSWTARLIALEEKIRLMQGLNSFGNTDFSKHVLVPQHDDAAQVQGSGTFQDTLTGHAAEWYSQLKKISHWKELADTFLAQYGFNSQIAPDRFDLQRMEKKSNETFREYAQRIEDALKTKKIVDMTALMALAEQAAKKAPTKKKGRRRANDRKKQWKTEASSPNFHHAADTTKAGSDPGSDSSSGPGPNTPDTGETSRRHQYHPRKTRHREPLRFNHDPTNCPC
uniref:Retrotransposon gag domain-containing protein n=1 Tax=Fagus sylvatica TaxID=28930 RepID=A0A2N9I3T2_FAGSY